jgi:hypothetical protein
MGLHLKFIDYDSRNAMEFYTRKMYFFSSWNPIVWDTNTENFESYRSNYESYNILIRQAVLKK